MEENKRNNINLPFVIGICSLVALIIGGIILFCVSRNSGVFPKNGELNFAENVPTELQEDIRHLMSETTLNSDLNISLQRELNLRAEQPLYNIYVPITDFYDTRSTISSEELNQATLIPVLELTNSQKLLAIDNNYYLNNFDSGAVFEYITMSGDATDIKTLTEKLPSILLNFPTNENVLSFAQTGVTALSRGMNAKLAKVKDAKYFSAKIAPYLNKFDLTHTSNESSFSQSANANNICAKPDMIDVLTSSGIDIIELTGNHNQDCGDQDAISTIDLYEQLGLKTVGGGKNQTSAAAPLEINLKDNHITMLAYNLSTGGYTLDDTPGANFYTKEKAGADIAAAKERGDFIIIDVQYYECNSYADTKENTTCDFADSSAGDQIGFFRELIDMGADLVVGTSAHQPQTFELYHGKPIYYGLGNLFFDQYWWPGTTRSLVLEHYFYQNKLLQTKIQPTVYDQNFQTTLLADEKATEFLKRLIQARPADSDSVRSEPQTNETEGEKS